MIDGTLNEIRAFIIESFLFGDGERIKNDTPLLEGHIVDSTGILEIVSFLEEEYGIRVEDDELLPQNLDSIEKINGFLQAKQAAIN